MSSVMRNKDVEKLATELAALTGEPKTEAVTRAIRERLERIRKVPAAVRLASELDEIAQHCAALPVVDRRRADEILSYDENGLPD